MRRVVTVLVSLFFVLGVNSALAKKAEKKLTDKELQDKCCVAAPPADCQKLKVKCPAPEAPVAPEAEVPAPQK